MGIEAIEILGIFGVSFVLALSGALMPGPLLTVTITESVKKGPWVGPLVILGHGILELALVILIVLGLGPYLKVSTVTATVALLGGIILMVMGYSMFKEAKKAAIPKYRGGDQEGHIGKGGPVFMGVVMSISNPYWLLWWLTIGLGYLTSAMHMGILGVSSFFLGHITADLAWYTAVSTAMSKGASIMSRGTYQFILLGCATCLMIFGAWFIYNAYSTFWV